MGLWRRNREKDSDHPEKSNFIRAKSWLSVYRIKPSSPFIFLPEKVSAFTMSLSPSLIWSMIKHLPELCPTLQRESPGDPTTRGCDAEVAAKERNDHLAILLSRVWAQKIASIASVLFVNRPVTGRRGRWAREEVQGFMISFRFLKAGAIPGAVMRLLLLTNGPSDNLWVIGPDQSSLLLTLFLFLAQEKPIYSRWIIYWKRGMGGLDRFKISFELFSPITVSSVYIIERFSYESRFKYI